MLCDFHLFNKKVNFLGRLQFVLFLSLARKPDETFHFGDNIDEVFFGNCSTCFEESFHAVNGGIGKGDDFLAQLKASLDNVRQVHFEDFAIVLEVNFDGE